NIFNLFKTAKTASAKKPTTPTEELTATKKPDTTSIPSPIAPKETGPAADELTYQTLSGDIQGKDAANPGSSGETSQTQNTAVTTLKGVSGTSSLSGFDVRKNSIISSSQIDSEDLSHQALATNLQGKGIFEIFTPGKTDDARAAAAQQSLSAGFTGPAPASDAARENNRTMLAQAEPDDLSHQALSSVINHEREKDNFYYVKTGGAIPILDKTLRDFVSYGGTVSFGVGKKINENLSLSLGIDVTMLTGDWSRSGSRQSLQVAAEQWAPGIVSQPGQTTVNAEDLPDTNLGIGVHSEATAQITSSESLKRLDVHTDLYLFPITMNALYKFDKIGNVSPYVGGGLGFCTASRDSESKALKSKSFQGPDYKISLNNTQSVNGLLLQMLGGVSMSIYKNVKLMAEANATWYDLKSFDPIFEISFRTPTTNPDITSFSYENPKHIGVFNKEFVGNVVVGLVVPF
ncbi:MAG TPA: hypothetical protein VMU10_09440, partial [Desulfomonilia bacterium]|nr:hypothetical protein [Desulfomonilia bacterium]